jgi:hypothetical protein
MFKSSSRECRNGSVKSAVVGDRVKRGFEASRFEDVRERKEDNFRVEGWKGGTRDRIGVLIFLTSWFLVDWFMFIVGVQYTK